MVVGLGGGAGLFGNFLSLFDSIGWVYSVEIVYSTKIIGH